MHTQISNNKRKDRLAKEFTKLTAADVMPPMPGDDDYIDQENGQCCCGEYNCDEAYVHWTSGY